MKSKIRSLPVDLLFEAAPKNTIPRGERNKKVPEVAIYQRSLCRSYKTKHKHNTVAHTPNPTLFIQYSYNTSRGTKPYRSFERSTEEDRQKGRARRSTSTQRRLTFSSSQLQGDFRGFLSSSEQLRCLSRFVVVSLCGRRSFAFVYHHGDDR